MLATWYSDESRFVHLIESRSKMLFHAISRKGSFRLNTAFIRTVICFFLDFQARQECVLGLLCETRKYGNTDIMCEFTPFLNSHEISYRCFRALTAKRRLGWLLSPATANDLLPDRSAASILRPQGVRGTVSPNRAVVVVFCRIINRCLPSES